MIRRPPRSTRTDTRFPYTTLFRSAAAASADWANAKDFYLVMTNAPGENSWPITATNFILMYKQPKNAATAKNAKEFFQWVYANGDDQAKTLDYVPLPDKLVQQIEAYWSQERKRVVKGKRG